MGDVIAVHGCEGDGYLGAFSQVSFNDRSGRSDERSQFMLTRGKLTGDGDGLVTELVDAAGEKAELDPLDGDWRFLRARSEEAGNCPYELAPAPEHTSSILVRR